MIIVKITIGGVTLNSNEKNQNTKLKIDQIVNHLNKEIIKKMFKRTLLLVTLCLALPSTILTQDANSLLDPNFIKQFLPAEYHSTAESTAQQLKAVVGGGSAPLPTAAPTPTLSGLTGQISTQTPIPSIPLPSSSLQYTPPQAPVHSHPHSHSGSFNPYMPAAPVASTGAAPAAPAAPVQHTHYAQPAAPAPVVSAPAATNGVANPFLGETPEQTSQPAQDLILKADLNANPVFHPPLESTVPQFPPIEGQHWYQYVLADNSMNPLN
jgi:hypothetical protein